MARRNDTARAERIIRLLPTIMGSIARWRNDWIALGEPEQRSIQRSSADGKNSGEKAPKLTLNQFRALSVIRDRRECSVNDLANRLVTAQSTASQLIDRLVKAGYITKGTFAGDRRRMVVTLSRLGVQMLEQRRKSLIHEYAHILAKLDEADQELLEDAFEKFYRVAAKLNQAPISRKG
jgi:DNA-binding MarR family transcriptional regulator